MSTKEEKTTRVTIECPIFPGFYETMLSDGYYDDASEVEYFKEIGKIPDNIDSLDVDFTYNCNQYQLDVCEAYCEGIEEFIVNYGLGENVKFNELISPKYYNYSTDRLIIDLDINLNNIKKVIRDNLDNFKTFLQENYASYDGFISFIDNNSSIFIDKLTALESGYVSVALGFCLNVLYQGRESLSYELSIRAIEDIDLSYYLESIEYRQDGEWVKADLKQ